MSWKQDDLGYFVSLGMRSAQIVRDGRRWRWVIYTASGAKLAQARSRTLDDAKDSAEWMLRT